MNLSDSNRGIHRHKRPRRIGRGVGSGHGKTAGRGHKGQGQLAGWSAHPAFEGGQTQLVRRVPKRGFHNRFAPEIFVVNIADLDELFEAGEEVTVDTLRAKGRIKGEIELLKILGNGELSKKLKVSAHRFSNAALEKIRQAGGEAIVVPGPKPVSERSAPASE
jgi:large subunit ribosomal protein L15